MRKALVGGGAVILIGLAWAWSSYVGTQRAEAAILNASAPIAESAIHDIDITAQGRDVIVSGIADSEAERDRLISALQEIDDVDEIDQTGLTILPKVAPYNFAVTRKSGRMVMQGHIPTEAMRAALTEAGVEGGDGLTLASGAPDRWETVAGAAVAALSQMQEGSLSMEDSKLRLTGLVDTSEDRDAIMAALPMPEGYTLSADIETVEPDATLDLELSFDANTGLALAGLVPAGITATGIADALGVQATTGEVEAADEGDAARLNQTLAAIKPMLARVERLTLTLQDDTASARGSSLPGVAPELVSTDLAAVLGADAEIDITELAVLPAEGTTRVNAATGERERFSAGAWLPDRPFTPSLQACTQRAQDLLSRAPVSFVGGGSQMDAQGARAIPALAELVRRCVREAGLIVQIGGHTDNRGSNNYQLSAERAVVVRQALISQGINPEALSAVGFGASKPIADNGTDAGRAANRRITLAFGYRG